MLPATVLLSSSLAQFTLRNEGHTSASGNSIQLLKRSNCIKLFLLCAVVSLWFNSSAQTKPLVLKQTSFKHYVDYFNTMETPNIEQAIPNDSAWGWMKKNIPQRDEFDYSHIDSLAKFTDMHPLVMHKRIEKLNWQFNFDPTMRNLSLKHRFYELFEKKFGLTIGEYKNYKLI